MTKFTPGPWHWVEDTWWGGYAALVDAEDDVVLTPDHCNDGDDGAAWFEEYPSEADARLIAAAPNMWVAIRNLVTALDDGRIKLPDTNRALIIETHLRAALELAGECDERT